MSMSVEELTKPRYKHIAPYPLSKTYMSVGDILEWDGSSYIGGKNCSMAKATIESFPHLFRKLEWWEHREEKDMPEYIRFYQPLPRKFSIGKVTSWMPRTNGDMWVCLESNTNQNIILGTEDIPATIEEYNSYIKTKGE